MAEGASVLAVFVLLCLSAGLGLVAARRLPERHRTRETVELMQLAIGLLATFAAIVLGLLTASVKQDYDGAALDRQHYALELAALYACLGEYGAETATARAELRSYTAAVIASTWPGKKPPAGVAYPDTAHMPRTGASPVLARLMDRVGVEIVGLAPAAPRQQRLAALCMDRYRDVSQARIEVIEAARNKLFEPFYQVLVFWLMVMFACFGLVAPPNRLALVVILLCAVSMTSVIFVIVDLSRPYGGFFSIPSTSMRTALTAMLRQGP